MFDYRSLLFAEERSGRQALYLVSTVTMVSFIWSMSVASLSHSVSELRAGPGVAARDERIAVPRPNRPAAAKAPARVAANDAGHDRSLDLAPFLLAQPAWQRLGMIAFLSCLEEFLRLTPLIAVAMAHRRWPKVVRRPAVLAAVAVTGALFGLAHATNGLHWLFALSAQGVGGVLMNVVYLRAGGWWGRHGRGFLASWLMHFSFNGLCLASVLLH